MRTKFIRLGVRLILCLPMCVALGYLGSFFVPRQYYSKVTMEMEPDEYKIGIFTERNTPPAKPPDYYFDSIRSKEVLYPVIDELKLVNKWSGGGAMLSKEQVYTKLLKMMVLQEVRNTGLLEIGVYSTDPQEAADIANVIAVQYRKWSSEDEEKTFNRYLLKLKDEIEQQRKKVEEAKAELMKIAQINHIPEADADPAQAELKASQFNLLRSREKEAQAHVTELTVHLDQITKMTPDDVTESTVPIINSAPMDILQLYHDTKAKEHALIKGGVAEDDTRLKDLRSRAEVYRNQLQERIDWTKRSLTASLPIAQDDLTQRETAVGDLARSFHGSGSPEYLEAKDKYFGEKKKLDEAEAHLATDVQIGFWTAKIWEKAERADAPARPNVPMILLVSAGIGLLFAIHGEVLLLRGLRMEET